MSERIDSSHALCRERMAGRLAAHLWAELTAGRLISTPEILATGIRRLCDEFDRTGNRRCLRFFRAAERQAKERHQATTDTWRLVVDKLLELDREAQAARARREEYARQMVDETFDLMMTDPRPLTGGIR